MKLDYRWGKPTVLFRFAHTPENLKGIKPHHLKTYCGCKCIEIDEYGWGRFQLCRIHVERTHLGYGATLIPEVKVVIPLDLWTAIKIRVRNWRI